MKKQILILGAVSVLGLLAFAANAYAATPTFTLTQNGSTFTLSVSGGPGISPVYFYYYDAGLNNSFTSKLVGTTDANGNLATPLTFTTSSYNGVPGLGTYVMVGGSQSDIQNWPGSTSSNASTNTSATTTSSGSLTFDFPNLTASVGSSATASVSGGTNYYISNISVSGVATASLNNNNLVVSGMAPGSTVITVCSASNGCGNVNVTVNASGSTATATTTATTATTTITTITQPAVLDTTSIISTVQSIQAQIAQILAQIQVMNTALAKITSSLSGQVAGASIVVTPTTASTGTFTQLLKSGSDGAQVLALQKYLAQKGLFTGTPNGHFGPATESAVKAYQSALGLEQVGYVGAQTRAALNTGK